MQTHLSTRRGGFTLTEMLVTIGILLVLASMVVAVFLGLWARGENVHSGATTVQQTLRIAKSRALADQHPIGIRFYTTNYLATEMNFIESPHDLGGLGTILVSGNTVTFLTGNVTGGLTNKSEWPVQSGDYIELQGGGLVYRIEKVAPTVLTLASIPQQPIQTNEYRVIRSPRLLIGETPVKLPSDVVLDTLTNTTYENPLPFTQLGSNPGDGYVDFLFAPSGRVLDSTNSDGSFLWLRRATADDPRSGAMVITIKYKTGWIAVNEIGANGTNPYANANDPRQSGF